MEIPSNFYRPDDRCCATVVASSSSSRLDDDNLPSKQHPRIHSDGRQGGRLYLSVTKALVTGTMLIGTLIASRVVTSMSNFPSPPSDNINSHHLRRQEISSLLSTRFLEEAGSGECTLDCCTQFENDLCPDENEWINVLPFAIQIILMIVLLSGSALFSGLTLGLMSLDKTGLEIVMGGDDPQAAEYARKIYPVRENGNLLLCTLLLGNVAVNALLSIILAVFAGGIVGFVSSTFLIVIFGEIVPQALCSRYALRIGSATVPIVKVIRFFVFPVAAPLAWALDKALGRELASTYSSTEMIKLLQIHVQENVIDSETAGAMTGALTYKNIAVKDVMTPIDKTFMLSVDEKLSFETIARIFRTGYSRIPVFEVSRNNVIGLLFVKDLIFIDPEDDTPIRSFVQIFGRGVHVVWPDDKLGDVLAELKQGKSHLALVRDVNNEDETQDPFYELKGIITLEDIIEKILGDRIVDETDAFIDNAQRIKVMRGESFDWARLRLLDTKIVDEMLSFSEVRAVTAHLRMNYAGAVQLLTDIQLERLVTQTPVSNLPTASQDIGQPLPNELLYKKGVPNDTCTLILGGKVTILVGKENFRSDISSWTLLASSALTDPNYTPDFTAYVSDGPCRCLQFTHQAFLAAMDASAVERRLEVERKQAAAAIVSSQEQAAAPEAAASPETLAKDKKEASDHRNRREKLIAAMQMFKKDDDSSQEGDEGEPEVTTPKPKETSVRFQQGGGFLTNSSRNVSSQETPGTDSLASSNQLSSIEEQSSPPASPVKSSTNVIDEGKETEPKSGDSGEK